MATISINNLARAIYDSSLNKTDGELNAITKNTIRLISDKHMLGKINPILEALEKIIDKEEGKVRARISSCEKISKDISEEIKEFIKDRYKSKDVILTFIEDERLLGGIKIEIDDEVIDTTLANKVKQLQDYLITN